MFDSILSKSKRSSGTAAGAGLSLAVYGALALGGAFFLSRQKALLAPEVDVTLMSAPPPAPPPPPPPPAAPAAAAARPRTVEIKPIEKKEVVPDPDHVVTEAPPPDQAAPAGSVGGTGTAQGGSADGMPGGVPGGVAGGVPGGTGTVVVPFGPGMVRPEAIVGGRPDYTPGAMAARVEGKVLVRCVITIAGEATNCRIIKSVPMLDEIVLDTLRRARYSPATFQGAPVSVQYLLTFNFKLP